MNSATITTVLPNGAVFQLAQGDISEEATGAIVNAANARLLHGAGVAGAISRRGGPEIQAESDEWVRMNGPVSHDKPAWTSGGRLRAKYVIHAVGPVWRDTPQKGAESSEDAHLDEAVTGSLRVADGLGVDSIALPAISTGIFGFPKGRAANLIIRAVRRYFEAKPKSGLKTVRLVLYDEPTLSVFQKAWHDHFSA